MHENEEEGTTGEAASSSGGWLLLSILSSWACRHTTRQPSFQP